MAYTDIDKPSDYFETLFYTGNASSPRTISGVGFSPDLVWCKNRTTANDNRLVDQVRGANKEISSNRTLAEYSNNSDGNLTSFNSDGFVITQGSTNINNWNKNSDAYVVWSWKAGTSFTNDASGTGIGTIDSAGSVNQDAGFSICSYTGTGSAGTIKHGLSSTPNVIIIKKRSSDSGDNSWFVYHDKVITAGASNRSFMLLDTAAALGANGSATTFTSVSSTTFGVGTDDIIGESSHTFIAYCFAEKQGYSKFGSYIGNGNADGTFIFTGLKPAFVMLKRTDAASQWRMWDNKRNTFNVVNKALLPNAASEEQENTNQNIDFLSNGFKIRAAYADTNTSGSPYIYMAFAENPFVTSTGVPATAR